MKFKILVENKTDNSGIMAEHGLSIYIEAHGKKILMDSGSTDIFLKNAQKMGVDISAVDLAVVSHGHYDHTGGFPAFCRVNSKAPVYMHKNGFRASYGMKNNALRSNTSGIRWNEEERADVEKRMIFTDGPVEINENIKLSGPIETEPDFEPTGKFYYKDSSGELAEDDMSHEQCLVIREETGIYVFSGCSHRGAVSAIRAGKKMFPGEKVNAFIGGLHLYNSGKEEREDVIEQLAAEDAEKIIPLHCTGIEGVCDVRNRFGDRCIIASAGDSFDVC